MYTRIILIANQKSGQNSRDAEAINRVMTVFGDRAERMDWDPGSPIEETVSRALAREPEIVVVAGGDGTVMAVASALLGTGVPMGVLPLGTFNFFARGLGLSETPEEAGRQLQTAEAHDIRVGMVNGQAFLNNASLGIYPAILRERETVYSRWGRFRLAAHWSVVKTFLRFRKPMKITLTVDGKRETRRTALVFVARSAYQLNLFGIDGEDAIDADRFAILLARAETRFALFMMSLRLALGRPMRGREYDLISAEAADIETKQRRTLVAFDGEKQRVRGPFRFRMSDESLTVLLPKSDAED